MENPMIEEKKRPDFLTTLCVLSFIGSSFGVLGSIFMIFMGNPETISSLTSLMEESGQELPEMFVNSLEHATGIGVSTMFLSLASLIGAIMMFNLKREGFYLYTLALVLGLFVAPLFNGIGSFSFWSLFINAIWIAMYARNLKYMTESCSCCCSSSCSKE